MTLKLYYYSSKTQQELSLTFYFHNVSEIKPLLWKQEAASKCLTAGNWKPETIHTSDLWAKWNIPWLLPDSLVVLLVRMNLTTYTSLLPLSLIINRSPSSYHNFSHDQPALDKLNFHRKSQFFKNGKKTCIEQFDLLHWRLIFYYRII